MGKSVARLFEQFQPEHYQLSLLPDRDKLTFAGTVTIRGKKTGRPSQRLTFHQKELKITSASIIKHDKKGDQQIVVSRINNQDSLNEVRLHSEGVIYPGEYTITMEFAGIITKPMNGIYPCYFKHDGKDKMLIATQFESHHAREAFPCIDEPEAKATFDLILTTPAGETVIANTPVQKQTVKGKLQVTSFETTPRMSTYLLAFAYGELGYTEATTKDGVVVRSYATPGNVEQTPFGVDVAVRCLEFFSDYFGTPYPLPKLDMLALPDFSSGAMENWGLVTFRETTLLTDEKTSSIESKQLVAIVINHELSHQWFGNLVTMKWWNDLWLNESFADLMEYRATDALYPEWHIWEQFVALEAGSAKRRDNLVDVQPIRMEVHHPDEISTLFDPAIVYAKGGTILHMLMQYIGEDAFQAGIKNYFKKHAYGNTTAEDLWEALGAASKQDITGFMAGWLNRPGYPLVNVDWKPGDTVVALKQHRFLGDPVATSDDTTPWEVPLASTVELDQKLFNTATASLQVTGDPKAALLLNHDGYSYFIPRYNEPKHLQAIEDAIKAGTVSTIDRLLLLDNYVMMQRSGDSKTVELLELLPAYAGESSESVWGAIAMAIGETRKLIEGDEASENRLNAMIERLVTPLVERLGWKDDPNDSAQTLRLRGLAISLAAGAKVSSVLDEGKRLFAAFEKPQDLSPTIRTAVYFIGARHGSPDDFKKLLALHSNARSADERDELASGLTSTRTPADYRQLLSMLDGDEIRRQDLMHWFVWLLRNRFARTDAWAWLTGHWEWIEKEFSSDKSYSFFARYAGSIFSRPDELKQYAAFFGPKKSIVAMSRDISLGEAEIAGRIAWRKRNEAAVIAWLAKN